MNTTIPSIAFRSWLPAMLATMLLLAGAASTARAWYDTDPVRFQRISGDQGLSQRMVYTIFQDSRGYMWFGTRDGLNRYDGYSFVQYMHLPYARNTMPSGVVRAICEDRAGRLWIATMRGGLVMFNARRDSLISIRHDPRDPASLIDDNVMDVLIDRSGDLWIAGLNGGIGRLDNAAGYDGRSPAHFTQYWLYSSDSGNAPPGVIYRMAQGPQGEIWLATDQGLCSFDPTTGRFSPYAEQPDPDYTDPVFSVTIDRRGKVWLGLGGGLAYLDRPTGRIRPCIPAAVVSGMAEDRDGAIWFASSEGLNVFDPATGRHKTFRHDPADPGSLASSLTLSVCIDSSGGIWVGTDKGIHRVDHDASRFHYYGAGSGPLSILDGLDIRSLLEDRSGTLWIGSSGQGLMEFNRRTGTIRAYRMGNVVNDAGEFINTIYEDRSGTLWVGTRVGLGWLDHGSGKIIYVSDMFRIPLAMSINIWAIREDRQGMFWVGTGAGLMCIDPKQRRTRIVPYAEGDADPSASNSVWIIHEDRQGDLWLGTTTGLYCMKRSTGNFVRYHHDPDNPSTLSHNEVWYIHEDRAGAIWVGTWGGGINRFNRATGTFAHYTSSDGLPSNVIHGILEDSTGMLWISSGRGLFRLDPMHGAISRFDRSDGLQSDEFNPKACARTHDGAMFFAGPNGLNSFFPDRVVSAGSYDAPIVITSHRRLDSLVTRELLEGEVVEIGPDENSFSFEFTALGYRGPGKILYAYMLEGFDGDWVQSGTRRYATYTNLAPGEYLFRVKATNDDGAWNRREMMVKVTVIPSFWNTWRFRDWPP